MIQLCQASSETENLSTDTCRRVDCGTNHRHRSFPERQIDRLKNPQGTFGNRSFTVAFYVRSPEGGEGEKVPPLCTTKKFFIDTWHYLRHRRRTVLHGRSTPIHYRYTILHWRVTLHHHRRTCALGSHQRHDHGCDHTHVPA